MSIELRRGVSELVRVVRAVKPPPVGLEPFGGDQDDLINSILDGPDEDKALLAQMIGPEFETERQFETALRRLLSSPAPVPAPGGLSPSP